MDVFAYYNWDAFKTCKLVSYEVKCFYADDHVGDPNICIEDVSLLQHLHPNLLAKGASPLLTEL